MNKQLFLSTALFLLAKICFAQLAPPVVTCSTVLPNGVVEFNWLPPADPTNDFFNYEIFVNDGNGFTSMGLWGDINNTTYPIFTANGNLQSYSFYLVAQSQEGAQQSEPSDTLHSIFLTVGAIELGSIATLNWNSPGGSSGTEYSIYREYPAGTWSLIGSVPLGQTSYNDTLYGVCEEVTIGYRVELENTNGSCSSVSNVAQNEFQDLYGPVVPEVETISINPITEEVEIFWYPSPDPDTDYYLIQSITGDNNINVGQIDADLPEEFSQPAGNQQATALVVIAFDECENDNSYNTVYETIFANSQYLTCERQIDIQWSEYEGWAEDVNQYVLHQSLNGEGDEIIATLSADELSYTVEDTDVNTDYCFWIEAVSNGMQRSSFSNKTCQQTTYPGLISFNYLSRVTVDENDHIAVHLLQDPLGENTLFELHRKKPTDDDFKKIMEFTQTPEQEYVYLDTDVDASEGVYQYKWVAYDNCGEIISESNIGKNINLISSANSHELTNYLWWTDYAQWDGGVTEYQLWRKTEDEDNYSLFTTVSSESFNFQENVEPFMSEGGRFCYKIVAVEGENQFGEPQISESNISCATQEPLVWIPNAIIVDDPDESNRTFKPVASYINVEDYHMQIYNKWNQKIFETTNVQEGWDGKYEGHKQREDYYMYLILYKDGAGQSFLKRGVVYVLYEKELE